MSLDPGIAKRLLFVRFLLHQGVELAQKPYPMSASAILSLQDAVELFLVVAGHHLGVELSDKMPFEQWVGRVRFEDLGPVSAFPVIPGKVQALADPRELPGTPARTATVPARPFTPTSVQCQSPGIVEASLTRSGLSDGARSVLR